MDPALQRLLDERNIMTLMHRYLRHTDNCDGRGQASVWAYSNPDVRRVPFEQRAANYQRQMNAYSAVWHHASNFEFSFVDADTAHFTCTCFSWHRQKEYPKFPDRERWARYENTAVRTSDTPEGWGITDINFFIIGVYGMDDHRGPELMAEAARAARDPNRSPNSYYRDPVSFVGRQTWPASHGLGNSAPVTGR